jgi:hypothetical protein
MSTPRLTPACPDARDVTASVPTSLLTLRSAVIHYVALAYVPLMGRPGAEGPTFHDTARLAYESLAKLRRETQTYDSWHHEHVLDRARMLEVEIEGVWSERKRKRGLFTSLRLVQLDVAYHDAQRAVVELGLARQSGFGSLDTFTRWVFEDDDWHLLDDPGSQVPSAGVWSAGEYSYVWYEHTNCWHRPSDIIEESASDRETLRPYRINGYLE